MTINKKDQTTADNLRLAAHWINENVPEANIRMEWFRSVHSEGARDFDGAHYRSPTDCGTAGCLLGWCPFVPGLEAIESDFYTNTKHNPGHLDFFRFSDRVFPSLAGDRFEEVFGIELRFLSKEALIINMLAVATHLGGKIDG